MKIFPVEAELFHEGGRKVGLTDITKLTVALRSSSYAPKNLQMYYHTWCCARVGNLVAHIKGITRVFNKTVLKGIFGPRKAEGRKTGIAA